MSKNGNSRRCERLILEFGARCHYCREMTNNRLPVNHPKFRTVEHVVPRCMGGTYEAHNTVIACYGCNSELADSYFKCFCHFCSNARVVHELRSMSEFLPLGLVSPLIVC